MRVTSWRALGRGLLLAVLSGTVAAGHSSPSSTAMAGSPATYAAKWGDSLTSVAARFEMDVPALAELNGLKPIVRLKLGQELRIDNPHIIPDSLDDGILINVPQRMLFHFKSGKLQAAYPVAVGRRAWPTPRGDFEVLEKEKDKTWIVPVSIQEEMLATGKPVREKVPPGPENPLGRHWIRISPSEGIHGTNTPVSIY
jgi:L,D-transpeptidase ErfK/SrfK